MKKYLVTIITWLLFTSAPVIAEDTGPANAPNTIAILDTTTIIENMIAGGWAFNTFSRKDSSTEGYSSIIHRSFGNGKTKWPMTEWAFCVVALPGFEASDKIKVGQVKVNWQGTNYGNRPIWEGNCEHQEGPPNRTVIATPNREGLLLFFKRIGESGYTFK